MVGGVLDVSGAEGGEPVDDVWFVNVEDFAGLLFEFGFEDAFFVFEVGDAFDEDLWRVSGFDGFHEVFEGGVDFLQAGFVGGNVGGGLKFVLVELDGFFSNDVNIFVGEHGEGILKNDLFDPVFPEVFHVTVGAGCLFSAAYVIRITGTITVAVFGGGHGGATFTADHTVFKDVIEEAREAGRSFNGVEKSADYNTDKKGRINFLCPEGQSNGHNCRHKGPECSYHFLFP